MPLTRKFDSDPGADVRQAVTGLVVVRNINVGLPSAEGPNVLCTIGATVNDQGQPHVPYLASGMDAIAKRFGGFSPYVGEGSATGYEGNLYARMFRLQAQGDHVVVPVDMAVKSATIATGTDLLITLSRGVTSTSVRTLPAGTRIANDALTSATHCVRTLEDVTWDIGETGAKTVRFAPCESAVSGIGGTPADLSTLTGGVSGLDTIIDKPTLDTSETLTVTTTATTAMDDIDAAEMLLRYQAAFDALDNYELGLRSTLLVCDRDEATIGDALAQHCKDMEAQGYYRKCFISPPIGTTEANARTGHADSVDRTALNDDQTQYCHPAWRVSRPFMDADNLKAPDYGVLIPSAMAKAFLTSHFQPHHDASQVHAMLTRYRVIGVESTPDRSAHEKANICQPVMDRTAGLTGLNPTYHCDVSAYTKSGKRVYLYTLRGSDALTREIGVILSTWHKLPATADNQAGAAKAVGRLLERWTLAGRLGGYVEPTYSYDSENEEYTLQLDVQEPGTLRIITLFLTYGPGELGAEAA